MLKIKKQIFIIDHITKDKDTYNKANSISPESRNEFFYYAYYEIHHYY